MTPKVCLITREFGIFSRAWTQILRNLGIDYTLCVTTGSGVGANIQTPQGVFAAGSPDLRNYFRQFDAVILCDNTGNLATTSLINYSVFWMSWNDPEDPRSCFSTRTFPRRLPRADTTATSPTAFRLCVPTQAILQARSTPPMGAAPLGASC